MLNYFPKYFTQRAIWLYFIAIIAISLIFFGHNMSLLWIIFGIVEVVGFFFFASFFTKKWSTITEKKFIRKTIIVSALLRLFWVVFSYFFYIEMTGIPFEFMAADSLGYNEGATLGAINFKQGNFNIPAIFFWLGIDDYGYMTYLSFIYSIFDYSIFIARLLKVIWSTWTVVLVYKLTTRNFGENVGRMAAIFIMLMPNLIFYCGLHLKETEMVFISVAFLERADYLIRSKKFNFINIFPPAILAIILFTFRSILGAVAVFALLTSLLLSSKRVMFLGKRIVLTIWIVMTILFFVGGRIATQLETVWGNRKYNQKISMENRAKIEGGNTLSNKANVFIFAPAILIIPIPSMVATKEQELLMMIHGGNFIKDILSFFVFIFIFLVIKNGKWRDFSLLEVFFVGYLGIIAFSAFAQSERFHQPILPVYIIFAAYGVCNVTNKTKKYYDLYLVGLFFVFLAWNFVKLYGRGLI